MHFPVLCLCKKNTFMHIYAYLQSHEIKLMCVKDIAIGAIFDIRLKARHTVMLDLLTSFIPSIQ